MARMDVTELLRNEHREAEAGFALFEQTDDEKIRRGLAQTLVKALSIHAGVEELVVYPVIRDRVPGGRDMVDHALEEHQEVKELLVALERAAGQGDANLTILADRLKRAVMEHVAEEEGQVFPRLRQALSADERRDLGRQVMEAEVHAPTHPHPHAPNRPPANKVADMAAFVLDKARDLVLRR
jgi:hemerythrin superfamily protein